MEEIKSAQMKYIAILQDLIAKQEIEINELKEKLSEASLPSSSEVKHGHWVLRHVGAGHYWECSVCHKSQSIYLTENTKYCPICGSKMDEEDK